MSLQDISLNDVTHFIGHPEDILLSEEHLSEIVKTFDMVYIVIDESRCVLD